jgi:hypothetical protein
MNALSPRQSGVMPGPWSSLAILTGYWTYVTVSNVLYAHSMSINIAAITSEHVFARWDARVLQHLFLYPVFVASIWASLRLGWRPLWRALPLQLVLACGFSALGSPLLDLADILTGMSSFEQKHAGATMTSFLSVRDLAVWLGSAISFLLTYGFGVALITGFSTYRRFRDSELRVAALEREWNSARLSALRMQLSPHTLFNLLNTIRGNISWDPATAETMIVQLSDLLRRLLNAGERDFSMLADEVRFAGLYLELQQRRFPDRLVIDLPERERLPQVWVPSLILQPLIENAVVHGLAGHRATVDISLQVVSDQHTLTLRVVNPVAEKDTGRTEGIGLRNVRERLAVHFGDQATFSSRAVQGARWVAEIRIPLVADGPPAEAVDQRRAASRESLP